MFSRTSDAQVMADHIHFEPGAHDLTPEDVQKTASEVDGGDPWANEWNQAVSTRLDTYKPAALGLDSLNPYGLMEGGKDTTFQAKRAVWLILPDRPSVINDSEEVRVICGDHTYATGGQTTGATTFDRSIASAGGLGAAVLIGGVTGSFVDVFAHRYMQQVRGYDNVTGKFDKEKAQAVSRRHFFQQAGIVLGGVTYAWGRTMAPFSPWPTVTRILDDVEDKGISHLRFDNLIGDDLDVLNGRTALVTQKLMTAMVELGLTDQEGAVVMGNGHIQSAEDSIHNEDARLERIEVLAKFMFDAAKRGVLYYTDEAKKPVSVKRRIEGIKYYHPRYQVYKVLEPDDKAFEKDPKKEIERIVLFEGEFVDKAIAKLLK